MHLPFVCSDKKNIVGKAQILHARQCRREMVELLQVKIEKPWAGNYTIEQETTPNSDRFFLGLIPWDYNTGLTTNKTPSQGELTRGIWVAASNILTDISIVAAYLMIG